MDLVEENPYFFEQNSEVTNGSNVYTVKELLGEGSFSQVFLCSYKKKLPQKKRNSIQLDHIKGQQQYALKVIGPQKRGQYQIRAKKEIEILELLQGKENVVQIVENFQFGDYLIIVQELMDTSMRDLLICMQYQGFSFEQVSRWVKQIANGLQNLQNHKIIHGDIKPSNILFKDDVAYISDFGSAFYSTETISYSYIQSRYYRAPEVILETKNYSQIDLWGLGCLCAELYLGFPVFQGSSTHNQLEIIIKSSEYSNIEFLENTPKFSYYFEETEEGIHIKEEIQDTQEILKDLSQQQQSLVTIPKIERLADMEQYLTLSPIRIQYKYEKLKEEYKEFYNFVVHSLMVNHRIRLTLDELNDHRFIKSYEQVKKQG